MSLDVLAFGAHPDDLELSCGGTLALCVQQGKRVGLVDLTRGEMGTRGSAEERAAEADAAARVLGATVRENLDLGDGQLFETPERVEAIVRIIRRLRPAILLAPPTADFHPDHAAAGGLVKRAHYLAGVRKVAADVPPHRAGLLVHYLQHEVHPPSFIVDISSTIDVRRKAILCYASQLYDPTKCEPATMISAPTFLDEVEARARHFGSMIRSAFGEAFVQSSPPRVQDLFSLVTPS